MIKCLLFLIASSLTIQVSAQLSAPTSAVENPDVQSLQEIEHARAAVAAEFADAIQPEELGEGFETLRNAYSHLDPKKWVPADLLNLAVKYFDANKGKFKNQNYLTVVDFTPSSDKYLFFLIDLKSGKVERYRTTHGMGSDVDDDGFAESFGNVSGSNKSSLGYVRTAEVYSGDFGVSLRLEGLSNTNSNIRARAVVFHGWDGVKEAPVKQYRSRGCITMDWTHKDKVLEKIKNGSLMYVGTSN